MSDQQEQQDPGVQQTTWKQPAGHVPTDATQATQVEVDRVEGQTVLLNQSSASQLTGERVTMNESSARNLQTKSAQLEKSAVFSLESERTVLQESAVMNVAADSVRMVKSQSMMISANETHLEEGSKALLIITGGIKGEARALVTVPAAAFVAAVFGILVALVAALIQNSRR
jgi:hypothetical protein